VNGLNRDRWNRLWTTFSSAADASAWYDRLTELYGEPHRHYHNAQHIAECLREYDLARDLARQPAVVELAIWFHDAIYSPRATDNEERSADLARACGVEMGLHSPFQQSLAQLILATKQHDSSLDPDAPLLVDVDLSILGQPPERFWQYETQIRAEYKWVPQIIFGPKRAEILEQFLARKTIYRTAPFLRKYEEQARANLIASLEKLRKT
jgi:predicted metal-dependent HD superfamily phosphohydrolase